MWTTPRTYVTAETITASQLNVDIRDNLSWLYGPPSVLAVSSTDRRYDGPGVVAIDLDRTIDDNDGMRTLTSTLTPGGYTASAFFEVKTAGRYVVTGFAQYAKAAVSAAKVLAVALASVGAPEDWTVVAMKDNVNVGIAEPVNLTVKTIWAFAVGDLVSLVAQAGAFAGVSWEIGGPPAEPSMAMHWLGN